VTSTPLTSGAGPVARAFPLAVFALVAACATAEVGNDGDGQCLRPAGCSEESCCSEQLVCATIVCDGLGYVCGLDSAGSWSWLPDTQTTTCDDGDLCTENDRCVGGSCLGVQITCTTPPPARCIDRTLRSFSSPGTCSEGTCSYVEKDTVCRQGCADGQCIGQPCLGVQCTSPPSACHASPGTCTDGACSYTQLPAGSTCDTGDPCTAGGTCDAAGKCTGQPLTCSAANAKGACVNGACSYTCDSGYGNCNGGWTDGCETKLDTASNCGACGKTCSAGANATASCSGGSCAMTCKSPYQDCDGKSGNGCEIPVGVANQCDKSGLNSSRGCGTAYCGSSGTSGAANFGDWTCVFCNHCHLFSGGYSWCLFSGSSTGQFSSDTCATCCNSTLADKVCPK
jgi:hypothetical protein